MLNYLEQRIVTRLRPLIMTAVITAALIGNSSLELPGFAATETPPPKDAWTALTTMILKELPLPEPIAIPMAEVVSDSAAKGVPKDFIKANEELRKGDNKLASALYQALTNIPQGARFYPVYYYNWGIAAMNSGDLPAARWAFRSGIGILNKQGANPYYDEIAARDLALEGFSVRSYHFYINLCRLYIMDPQYQDTERLVGEIKKQGRSGSELFKYLKGFLERNDLYPAHLIWAVSNFERLLRYPAHCRHPIIRYNAALALIKLGDPALAHRFLNFNESIGTDSMAKTDTAYQERVAKETAQLLSTEDVCYLKGICAALQFKVAEARRLLYDSKQTKDVQQVLNLIAPLELVLNQNAGLDGAALKKSDEYQDALRAAGITVEDFKESVFRRWYGTRITATEAEIEQRSYATALDLLVALREEVDDPVFNRMVRSKIWSCRLQTLIRDPMWICILVGFLIVIALLFPLRRNIAHIRRTLGCRYRPEPKFLKRQR